MRISATISYISRHQAHTFQLSGTHTTSFDPETFYAQVLSAESLPPKIPDQPHPHEYI